MIVAFVACAALVAADDPSALPSLSVGDVIHGRLEKSDRGVRSNGLDARAAILAPVHAKSYSVRVPADGTHTIDLSSPLFDAYLVLRDATGTVIAEDDDGLLRSHARIVADLRAGATYSVDACGLHDEVGSYDLSLVAGQPTAMTDAERAASSIEDARRELAVRESTLGPNDRRLAPTLDELAWYSSQKGDPEAARSFIVRALAIDEKAFGSESMEVAGALNSLAVTLHALGKSGDAVPLLERALAIQEKSVGPDQPDTARTLTNLGSILATNGKYERSIALLRRALDIRSKAPGPDTPDAAQTMGMLGNTLRAAGRIDEARPLLERALAIREKTVGPNDPRTALSLVDLAAVLIDRSECEKAQPLLERALAIREKWFGREHALTATTLSVLGLNFQAEGKLEDARRLLEQARDICEKVLAPDHPDVASTLNNLAAILRDQGKFDEARPLLERALAIHEKAFGPDHPFTAVSLDNLARLLRDLGKDDEAKPLLERALAIREKALDGDETDVARSLDNLAGVLEGQGKRAAATALLERALAIEEKALGPANPDTAAVMHNLAHALQSLGRFDDAKLLFERALVAQEKVLGRDHPSTLRSASMLALLSLDLGDVANARRLIEESLAAERTRTQSLVSTASEADSLIYAAAEKRDLELLLSMPATAESGGGNDVAYAAVLEWKGQVARSLGRGRARIFGSATAEQRDLMERLRSVQAALSNGIAAREIEDREEHEHRLERLRRDRMELESTIRRTGGVFAEEKPVAPSDVARSLPNGAAIVDFLVHRSWQRGEHKDGKLVGIGSFGEPRVSAWVLRKGEVRARWLDLGPSAPIEEAVQTYLADLVARRGVGRTAPMKVPSGPSPCDRLNRLLWAPIEKAVGDADRIFVCPDGFLGTLPFETLSDENQKFLVEKHPFVYVQDAASLVHTASAAPAAGGDATAALLVGAIDYDSIGTIRLLLARGLKEVGDVAGAVRQYEQIEAALEKTTWSAEQELPRFPIVHLATHGYFQPDGLPSMSESAQQRSNGRLDLGPEERLVAGYLPGFLSGLVCAGANRLEKNGDNGLLTADEVSWLDLRGCDLVVLSACETALGTTRAGEGMMSLRRAFHLAGARTVISSLWNVRDESTKDLMLAFYTRLWQKGQGKLEALRGAQLDMLARNRERYGQALPSTWGAFVLSGDWR
ncbi:MAG: CHAT domain-containing protein [Planctomycetes bacterium]|nr:CHAT domain-containing protein [Planctomycetota bacterium]